MVRRLLVSTLIAAAQHNKEQRPPPVPPLAGLRKSYIACETSSPKIRPDSIKLGMENKQRLLEFALNSFNCFAFFPSLFFWLGCAYGAYVPRPRAFESSRESKYMATRRGQQLLKKKKILNDERSH